MMSQIPIRMNNIPLKESDQQVLRASMIAELDAASLYDQMAASSSHPNVRKILKSIAEEEKVHFGEFLSQLNIEDGESAKAIAKGDIEARKLREVI